MVQLTPAFDGQVFYKKDIRTNTLTISGTEEGEVSMRLTGNRYDHEKWTNLRPDQDGDTAGTHVISSKPKGGERDAQAAAGGAVSETLTVIIESIVSSIREALQSGLEWFAGIFTANAAD